MKKRKIITSVINNYQEDQRVQKVCGSLQKMGFEVEVIATTLREKPQLNFPYKIHIIPLFFQTGMMIYLEFNFKLFLKLIFQTQKGDILLANDLDALLPNYLVSKIKNLELVFDSHEIFSEMPSLNGRTFKKKLWKSLEKCLIPKMNYFYTVSNGYAKWFEKEYGVKPLVVRNVPSDTFQADNHLTTNLPDNAKNEKVILYQGALNMSRGIDKMILSMNYLENVQLWIIGNGPKKHEFEELAKKEKVQEKVYFLGNQPPKQLKLITPNVDLGLSMEEDFGLSYKYSLPNKIFDYTKAGVPILATELPEIKETVEEFGLGRIITNHTPEFIAIDIKRMLDEGKEPYRENLKRAASFFTWENQEKTLYSIFENFK